MRRLPIYFLIDVSESMVGEPIAEVQKGIDTIINELNYDPYTLSTAYIAVIAFAGKAKVLSPLNEVYKYQTPKLPIGGGTALGKGLEALMDDMDKSVHPTTLEKKGDWKPIIFLFTDGTPTDDYSAAFARWNAKYRQRCNLVAISIGKNINTKILGQITENVMLLSEATPESFREVFNWVTMSIKASSELISSRNSDEAGLPKTDGINLQKVNPETDTKTDENFAVLFAQCQHKRKPYLIKYERIDYGNFGYVGAYQIDSEQYDALSDGKTKLRNINTNMLMGGGGCPVCENKIGLVVCDCGGIFCAREGAHTLCPWCGAEGELVAIGGDGMNVDRTIG